MAIDIGISEEDRKSIVDGLSRLLSDTYVLYLKTHNFHWNVTGPDVSHPAFDVRGAIQRVGLGRRFDCRAYSRARFPAPGAYAIYARLSSIKEEEGVPAPKT